MSPMAQDLNYQVPAPNITKYPHMAPSSTSQLVVSQLHWTSSTLQKAVIHLGWEKSYSSYMFAFPAHSPEQYHYPKT